MPCFILYIVIDICIFLACFLPLQSDIPSDHNPSNPTPDTIHTTPHKDSSGQDNPSPGLPLQDSLGLPTQDSPDTRNTIPLQDNSRPDNSGPGLPTQDSPDPQTPLQPTGNTIEPNGSRSSLDSPNGSLPEEIIQLTQQGLTDTDRESNRTPPFPLTPSSVPETVKRVNFDLEATTEINRNSLNSEDYQEKEGIDHISVFLTQGATEQQMKNGALENGHHVNGSIDSPTDLTFVDIDDANIPHFRRDLSQLSGHMTLPSPKKTTDQEVNIRGFILLSSFAVANFNT